MLPGIVTVAAIQIILLHTLSDIYLKKETITSDYNGTELWKGVRMWHNPFNYVAIQPYIFKGHSYFISSSWDILIWDANHLPQQ